MFFAKSNPLKKRPTYKFGTFDIETGHIHNNRYYPELDPRKFVMGWVYTGDDKLFFTNKDDMLAEMLRRKYMNYVWYAHNVIYDLMGLLHPKNIFLYFKGNNLLYNKSTFILAKKPVNWYVSKTGKKVKNYIRFYDSLNLFKTSLSKLGESIGNTKQLDLEEYKQHGIDPTIVKDYCLNDCVILYDALKRFMEMIWTTFKSRIGVTIASTALKIFRTNFMHDHWSIPYSNFDFRQAYFGGRTEVFQLGRWDNATEGSNLYYYDVNSLYPAMMCKQFPHPNFFRRWDGEEDFYRILDRYEGVARVTVDIPYSLIPPIPKKSDRMEFGYGKWGGWYTFPHLRMIRDRYGDECITNITKCHYSTRKFRPFNSYIRKMYRLRQEYKEKDSIEQLFIKKLMNSLYGKFGQLITEIIYGWEYETDKNKYYCEQHKTARSIWKLDPDEHKQCSKCRRKAKYYTRMDEFSRIFEDDRGFEWGFFSDGQELLTEHTIFPLCSYVTAYAHDHMQQYYEQCGYDNLIYTDTDSLITTHKLPTSNKLGELKLEYTIEKAWFLAPKHYAFFGWNENKKQYDTVLRIKGLDKTQRKDYLKQLDKDLFTIKDTFEILRFTKPKESLRRGIASGTVEFRTKTYNWEEIQKRIFNSYNLKKMNKSIPKDLSD